MKTIEVNVKGATTMAIDDLEDFQEGAKRLERDQYEKFRKLVIEQGISFVTHIWPHKGKNYIIDGHQRKTLWLQMRDEEGFKIPKIPIALVKADNMKSAKLKVLAGMSKFGTEDENAIEKFLTKNKINIDDAFTMFEIPNINLSELNVNLEKVEDLNDGSDGKGPDIKVSSDDVRQVQLYFDTKSYNEFMKMVEELSETFGTENVTDTILEALRAQLGRKKK